MNKSIKSIIYWSSSLFLLLSTINASIINTAIAATKHHPKQQQQQQQQKHSWKSYPDLKRENTYYERFGVWVNMSNMMFINYLI